MFDLDIFEHSLDDNIGLFKPTVVQLTRQIGQDGVSLERRDVSLFGFVIQSRINYYRCFMSVQLTPKHSQPLGGLSMSVFVFNFC